MIMQTLHKHFILLIVILFCITKSHSQSLPISGYGVWDRGGQITDFSNSNTDFVMGIEASDKWENIELVKGTFDFSSLQSAIDKAYLNNKLIRLSVDVGPDSPTWMYIGEPYSAGSPYPQIQKVYTFDGNAKSAWKYYPDYLSPTYKDYFWTFLQKFSDFIRNQPPGKFAKIAFVQVKSGCTGDEIPYKGLNPTVVITDQQWYDFRVAVFEKYKEYFNDVPDKKVVLTFNDVDPSDPNELYAWRWVTTRIDPAIGFGIKGGAFNRGHHLTAEQSYKNSLYNYLVNPTGLKLFSASEMDGTTQSTYFQICQDMSYYWAALGGLNVGLSTTNLNAVAMTYATTNAVGRETFRMYTKYAQQVYPALSTTAFSIFHDGLNSADITRFPEKDFGNTKATIDNTARYTAICKAYESRGARMDDLKAVVQGQVYQRGQQLGLNDAGWDIAEGNIERFITQIDPNNTSIGLFRVRGEITKTSSKYDRFARSFECKTNKNKMFFQVHPEFPANNKILKFTIIWLDRNVGGKWAFQYRNASGLQSQSFTGTGSNVWKTETFTLSDAIIDQGGERGSDFMLVNTDGDNQTGKQFDDTFNGIELNIIGSKQPQNINFNAIPDKKLGDPDFSLGATVDSGLTLSYVSSNELVAKYVNGKIQIVGIGSATITAYQAGNYIYEYAAVSQELRVAVVDQTTITTTGTWICPAGVNKITVECWGGGGSGGGAYAQCVGGGGAGGSYVTNTLAVTPLTSYTLTVGAGGVQTTNNGANGTNGGSTTFQCPTPVIANGGVGGFGSGAPSPLVPRAGAGGVNITGGSGGTITLGASGAGGAVGTSIYGGAGGSGGNSINSGALANTAVGAGTPAKTFGGGGCGGYGPAAPLTSGSNKGSSGAAGQVKISYIRSVPDAPIIGTATATGISGAVRVSFTAPAFDGNNGITSYTATASPGGRTATINQSGSGSITITGLTNGTAYTFTVRATNGIGQSAASAPSNAATPVRTSQSIVFNTIPTKTFGDADFDAGAIASSGLPVSYESSNSAVARIENGLIQIIGVGTAIITAYQEGDGTFSAATPVSRPITVLSLMVLSNGTGGGLWSVATSWALGVVPGLGATVSIVGSDIVTINSAASCNDLIIASASSLKVNAKSTLIVANAIANNGTLTFENMANLVQINNVPNFGTVSYKRNTTPISRFDYTYWSTPVLPCTLGVISPNTAGERFYSFDPSINNWKQEAATTAMVAGTGYIVRGPESFNDTSRAVYEAVFSGVPNNGNISISEVVPDASYLLGNPYPSPLDADSFLNANQNVLDGTLYFWTHNTPIAVKTPIIGTGLSSYSGDDYATYNLTGGTAAAVSSTKGGLNTNAPSGKIASGQGFFAGTKTVTAGFATSTPIVFTNAMRVGVGGIIGDNTQFFKTKNPAAKTATGIEKHRIWLNLTNEQGAFKQALIGYITDASNDYDSRFDGKSFDGNEFLDFYSLLQDTNLSIQGRGLPFDENDEIPLGYRVAVDGTFTIGIDQTDGILSQHAVFIEDKLTNTVYNLNDGTCTFTTAKGTFNDRFVLKYIYNKTLGVKETTLSKGIAVIFSNTDRTLFIKNNLKDVTVIAATLFNSSAQKISSWDVKGKEQANIQIPIKNLPSSIYIVKIITSKGVLSKKILIE
jgi:hypothetical protein